MVALRQEEPGFKSHVLPIHAWDLSGFLPLGIDISPPTLQEQAAFKVDSLAMRWREGEDMQERSHRVVT
ncbi:hypothetical protein AMECASPLE_012239 [Ameca splendens]|uniref:Uncharacterized protein n=1 Tax=Ameca splendens TaxID=208324 RepID=A0ABV1A7B1_9TELE